jgi:hypothetical protein
MAEESILRVVVAVELVGHRLELEVVEDRKMAQVLGVAEVVAGDRKMVQALGVAEVVAADRTMVQALGVAEVVAVDRTMVQALGVAAAEVVVALVGRRLDLVVVADRKLVQALEVVVVVALVAHTATLPVPVPPAATAASVHTNKFHVIPLFRYFGHATLLQT